MIATDSTRPRPVSNGVREMRLLICTQAVDKSDPVLGFMHRWIEEFAKRYENVIVVCLRAGEHRLPSNVEVIPLGENRRLLRALEVCSIAFARRKEYDSVFVHMNQEYVLAAGWLWRLLGKRIVLWRNHKIGFWSTRLAGKLAHTVCYTSPSAYVARFSNAVQMPIGIDTDLFANRDTDRKSNSILFFGRLDAVKNPDKFLETIARFREKDNRPHVDVVGDPTPGREAYAQALKEKFSDLDYVTFTSAIRNDQAPAEYGRHAVYVNLTPSGSFDKTIGEAAASGCILVVANEVLEGVLPKELIVDPTSVESIAKGIQTALAFSSTEREALSGRVVRYVQEKHSLTHLMDSLTPLLYD